MAIEENVRESAGVPFPLRSGTRHQIKVTVVVLTIGIKLPHPVDLRVVLVGRRRVGPALGLRAHHDLDRARCVWRRGIDWL